MASTMDKIFAKVCDPADVSSNKITVAGTGQVGMACIFSILTKGISSDVAMVDIFEDKLKGELMDLQHGLAFLRSAKIQASTDYSVTANSKVVIITAGVRQRGDESRLDLLQKNAEVFKQMIPQLVKYSPNAILLIVSNPVDILTYIAWKISGFPKNRVIGAGTNLDSSRFRFLISQKLNIATEDCHAWIIGEHGASCVPVWSGVNIVGMPLTQFNSNIGSEDDKEHWEEIHKQVVESGATVRKLKGYTSWAIGLSVATIVHSIVRNDNLIHAVSTCVKKPALKAGYMQTQWFEMRKGVWCPLTYMKKRDEEMVLESLDEQDEGQHGIDNEVFISLPCIIGANGATEIIIQTLTSEEIKRLHKSADILYEQIEQLHI